MLAKRIETRTSTFGLSVIRNSAFEVSPRALQVNAGKHYVIFIHQECGNGYIWSTTGRGKTLTSFMSSDQYSERKNVGYSLTGRKP